MLKLGVLISGNGSNLQAIIDAILAGTLDAEVVLVISSKPDAFGLKRAQQAGIATIGLTRDVYNSPLAADQLIAERFTAAGADYIVMAGYMRMVGAAILNAFPDRVINIHPALLPSFVGAHGIQDAWDYGVKVTGITVHFANAEYDKGPIIAQRAIEIYEHDSIDDLESRIHAVEHQLYPQVLQQLAQGRLSIDEQRHVRISQEA